MTVNIENLVEYLRIFLSIAGVAGLIFFALVTYGAKKYEKGWPDFWIVGPWTGISAFIAAIGVFWADVWPFLQGPAAWTLFE